jgi:hypothetical protein
MPLPTSCPRLLPLALRAPRTSMCALAVCTALSATMAATAAATAAMAQSAPRIASEALYSAGNSPACGAGVSLLTSAEYRGASVALLPAPVTTLSGKGLGAPVVAATVSTPDRHALQLEASGAVGRAPSACAGFSGYNRAWAALSYRFGRNGVMLSAGHKGLSTLDPSLNREGITVGVWRNMGRVNVSFDVRRDAQARDLVDQFTRTTTTWKPVLDSTLSGRADSIRQIDTDTVVASTRVQWPTTSLRTRLQLSLGRLALDLTFGGTAGSFVGNPRSAFADTTELASSTGRRRNDLRLWGRADARVALTSFMEAIGGVASLPPQQLGTSPARRMGTLGFAINGIPRISRAAGSNHDASSRVASPASFESVRDDAGTVRLRVRMPKASRVELSSELTGWTAIPMQKAGDEWWELPVQSPAGVYRVNIRVDGGAWQAPPSVSTVRDEFGGQVGLVKIS